MGAIAYWSALVRSKKPVGREVAFTKGYGKYPANWSRIGPKFGWYVNRKGRSRSGPLSGPVGFLQVHASAFHLLSRLLSPSTLQKLSFPAGVFFIFRNILLNFNFNQPQNVFLFEILLRVFFFKFL